jgi:hypothetical protein
MPIHICRNMIRRSSDGTTKPTKQRASSPPATQSSSTSFLTKTWYCFLWQLTPLDCGLILQHFLFDIKPTSPLTFTPPNLMPPWCNPNLCAYQAQKESSTWPITIGNLHNHTISTATRILPQSPLSPHPNNSNSLSQIIHTPYLLCYTYISWPIFSHSTPERSWSALFWSAGRSLKLTNR